MNKQQRAELLGKTSEAVRILQGLPFLTNYELTKARDRKWGYYAEGRWTTFDKQTGTFKFELHKNGKMTSFQVTGRSA